MPTDGVLQASPPSRNGNPTHWAAIAGRWHFDGSSASYQGPAPESVQPYGLALTDRNLTDGSARVRMKFDPSEVSGGFVLGFHSLNSRYILAQLGAYGTAYAVSEFLPEYGWKAIQRAGSAQNLDSNAEYELEVRQTGQELRMSVDGVRVLECILGQPLAGNQLGLFAFGKRQLDFRDLHVESARGQVFVAMQFGGPFDTLYQQVIFPQVEALGLRVVRMDDVARPGIIFEDMKRQISEAQIVIAEITAPNQNVFYELGYAHALNKPTILIAQRGKDLPFDIRSYRVIFYDDSIGGKPALESSLQKHLQAILNEARS